MVDKGATVSVVNGSVIEEVLVSSVVKGSVVGMSELLDECWGATDVGGRGGPAIRDVVIADVVGGSEAVEDGNKVERMDANGSPDPDWAVSVARVVVTEEVIARRTMSSRTSESLFAGYMHI